MIEYVIKRTGDTVPFEQSKIELAVNKAMKSIKIRSKNLAAEVTQEVISELLKEQEVVVGVDHIHQLTENVIMDMGLHDLAREYITYRAMNMPDIFRKRLNLKPYEYPQLLEYLDDMKVNMTPEEAKIVERAMLAISQIEVQVKTFWAKVGDRMQKPEVQAVGATFAESEVRHADAYSNLLELMGLNEEFRNVVEVPAIKKRMEYLEQSMGAVVENKDYFHNIILFSMFVENVSLFSQFLIMMAFNKHKNVLKGISNAVEATSKEEDIHARFGFELVNIIKAENPDWWTKETETAIKALTRQANKAEASIVDWIYGDIDLDFLPKDTVKEFLKWRFNESLEAIGIKPIYEVDAQAKKDTEWFIEEMLSTKNIDFFVKRSTAYSKKTKAFTEDDLF
jgi:ribonucleoside-diphosphate reductase beta chain